MTRTILAMLITANVLLALALASRADDYARLLVWACEHGNGGHECGEE
jgi:hypothetical protein